ncbi:MAG: hypothetical protein HAW60_03620 [Bdellovibrionales bacterium]|nr:hypothetical protein [Bdellovibrionales bacterium]
MKNCELKTNQLFNFANSFKYPQSSLTAEIKIFNFIPKAKEKNIKVSHFFLYAFSKAQWETPSFRLRIKDGKITKSDSLICVCPVNNPHTVLNHSVVVYKPDHGIEEFKKDSLKSEEIASSAKKFINPSGSNWFVVSITPFLDFTSSYPTINKHDHCSPLFLVSKFTIQDDIISFKLCSTFHSALVSHFCLQEFIDRFKSNIQNIDSLAL